MTVARSIIPVAYTVESVDRFKTGQGWVSGPVDQMREAFAAGECVLTVEDGADLRVFVMAHTPESATAYFTIRRN